ncbi:phage tail tube protein [Synergistes jonesii]|uniref:phage tail tube protein n=1 Tax=Synergistes jonesii TaxID=2754 RepID=UPI00242EEE5C|nr:phage major tail protein, TP901-1 family [Synergistes jonesii]
MPVTLPTNPNTSNAQVGKDFLLKINTGQAVSPTWTTVGGQRSADLNRNADSIDVSHKTSGSWKGFKAGLRGWSIDLGGLVLLTDAGVEALETAFVQGKEVNIALFYPDGTKQTGWGSITEFSISSPHDGAAEISGTIEGNGPLSERA